MTMTTSVSKEALLTEISPGYFKTVKKTESQGQNPNTGFGGFSIAVGLKAACATVDTTTFKIYSLLGTFLGPTDGRKPLYARVTTIRDTRTFATRRVDLLQDQQPSPPQQQPPSQQRQQQQQRTVLTFTADFMRPEKLSFVTYSRPARARWSGPEESLSMEEGGRRAREQGVASEREVCEGEERVKLAYQFIKAKFEKRSAPEGWFGQANVDVAVPARVPMDDLPPQSRGSAEWYRPWESLDSYVDTLLSYVYVLDSGISIDTTHWNRIPPADVAAVSSLEFALRFFTNDHVWRRAWLLREAWSHEAGLGRAYNEAVLRDQSGKVLVSMTQQTILRPRAGVKI